MKLVFPKPEYKDKAIDYINEFIEYGSEINGSGSLDRYLLEATYEEWLEKVISYMDIANIPKGKVPDLTYFYVREEDDRIVGMVNIRLALNDFLRNEAGHIGYSVRPTERRKHYATEMLRSSLEVLKAIGIKEALVPLRCRLPASREDGHRRLHRRIVRRRAVHPRMGLRGIIAHRPVHGDADAPKGMRTGDASCPFARHQRRDGTVECAPA